MARHALDRRTSYFVETVDPSLARNGVWVPFSCIACNNEAYAHYKRQASKVPLRFCPDCYETLTMSERVQCFIKRRKRDER